ncbi:RNA polymerase sigma-70 factor [Puteibacter caeruleilacunae]|nr:RNA polymerase sigma-70 factor [Puteibacter caeruleilacunae]
MNISEQLIIRNLESGDVNTFEFIFREMHAELYAYAGKFIDEQERIDDVVQDAFVYLWEHKNEIEITTSLRSYLFTVVRNNCLQLIRKDKVSGKYKDWALLELRERELNFYGFENQSIIEKELRDKIETAIGQLPPQCQEVFRLSRLQGLKNREIAEKLDISVKTVEKHMSKALKSLRSDLKDYMPLLISFLLLR